MLNRKTILILLTVLLAGRILFLFLFPVTDPSEARYSLIIKRMAETGNFLEPQLLMEGQWVNFEGKPPLFFQSGAVCAKVFGVNPFSVRFPALLAALGILGAIYFALRKMRDERTALHALLFCSFSSVFFLFSGRHYARKSLCVCLLKNFHFFLCGASCFRGMSSLIFEFISHLRIHILLFLSLSFLASLYFIKLFLCLPYLFTR